MIEAGKKQIKYPPQADFDRELKRFCPGLSESEREEISRRIYNSSFNDLEKRTFPRDWKKFMVQSPFVVQLIGDRQIHFTQQ